MVLVSARRSEKLALVGDYTERLYWRIHMASDNYGTMEATPWDVHLEAIAGVDGSSVARTADALDELVRMKLLERWTEPAGELAGSWIHVVNYDAAHDASHIKKRGERHSPVPPSERANSGVAEPVAVATPELEAVSPELGDHIDRDRDRSTALGGSSTQPPAPPLTAVPSAPSNAEQANAAIVKCRRLASTLALAADELVAAIAQARGVGSLEPTAQLDQVYRHVPLLVNEFGREVVGEALSAAIGKPEQVKNNPPKWPRSACTRIVESAAPKPPKVGDGRVYSVSDALAAYDGAAS